MVSILNAPAVPKAIFLLVVEDSEPYLYLIQRAFRDRREIRWNIVVAKDGEHALKNTVRRRTDKRTVARSHPAGVESAEDQRQRGASAYQGT